MKRGLTLTAWLREQKIKCSGLRWVERRYEVFVQEDDEWVEVPEKVWVEPEEEDRFKANPRRHLLLPGM